MHPLILAVQTHAAQICCASDHLNSTDQQVIKETLKLYMCFIPSLMRIIVAAFGYTTNTVML